MRIGEEYSGRNGSIYCGIVSNSRSSCSLYNMDSGAKYITGLDALGSSISCGVIYHIIVVLLSQATDCIVSIGYCIDRRAPMVIVMLAMVEATLLAVAIVVRDYRVNLLHTSSS